MLMVNRAYLDSSWSYAPVHDWITYACVAATFATAARLYNTSILTYAAAITVTLSTIPQWIIFG